MVCVPHLKVNLTAGAFIKLNKEIVTRMKIAACYRILDIACRRSDVPQHERISIHQDNTYSQLQMYFQVDREVGSEHNILRSTAEQINEVYQTGNFVWSLCVNDMRNTCFIFKEQDAKNKNFNCISSKICYIIRYKLVAGNKLIEVDSNECLPFPCSYESFTNIWHQSLPQKIWNSFDILLLNLNSILIRST